jgi:hypothetical protein
MPNYCWVLVAFLISAEGFTPCSHNPIKFPAFLRPKGQYHVNVQGHALQLHQDPFHRPCFASRIHCSRQSFHDEEGTEKSNVNLGRRSATAAVSALLLSVISPYPGASAGEIWRRPDGTGFSTVLAQTETTFSLRFVTYLSRFLLNYESTSANWWRKSQQTQELILVRQEELLVKRLEQFGRYAASVEIGLARYQGQEGTEALAELMIARYGWISREVLKQMAFLFALLDEYQPTARIGDMLSRADNSTVTSVKLVLRGSGYTGKAPEVRIETPDYTPAQECRATASVRESGRILRIKVLDGGSGYLTPPKVIFTRVVQPTKDGVWPANISSLSAPAPAPAPADQATLPFKVPCLGTEQTHRSSTFSLPLQQYIFFM